MTKTSSKLIFFIMTMISTIMIMSSSDWLNMWIGLEINLMSFIPLMFNKKNSFLSQSSMVYFLIQSLASTILIMTILMNMYMLINMMNKEMMIIMFLMMMKMGMPPFHMWLPNLMSNLSWKMCMMLMTWQKIAPMYILSMIMNNNHITMMIIILSTIIGAIMGLNHTSIRKIMAYSSINHMGWLMTCASMYKKIWMMYMIMYSMMIIMMCMNMYKYNIMYINQFNISSLSMSEKLSFTIMMLSMGGLPPFLGFMPKWITIEYMISSNEMMLMFMMTMSSLITLSYYMRMISSMIMIMSNSQKWINMLKMKKTSTTMMLYINMSLPMFIFLFNFM